MIINLLDGFSLVRVGENTVDTYFHAVREYGLPAVRSAVGDYLRGHVSRADHSRPPSAPEFAIEVRSQYDRIQRRQAHQTGKIDQDRVPAGCRLVAGGTMLSIPIGHPLATSPDRTMPEGSAINYGFGRISLAGLTAREVEMVERLGGRTPDGQSMAGMDESVLKAALADAKRLASEKRREIAAA